MSQEETTQLLLKCIECIFNPASSSESRTQAHRNLEEFRESNPERCAEIGFRLLAIGEAVFVKQSGLQLVETTIRFGWDKIAPETRVAIRNQCFTLIEDGWRNSSAAYNPRPLQEALSRCIVGMVKREWPQNWPDFINDCEKLCSNGESQIELVLMILRRLVQDVVTLSPDGPLAPREKARSQELQNCIVTHIPKIAEIASNALKHYCLGQTIPERLKCAVASLELCVELLDWIPPHVLDTDYSRFLLSEICSLLNDSHWQLAVNSSQCLEQLTSRKHHKKREELVPLKQIFGENEMTKILIAAKRAIDHSFEEDQYKFLRSLCVTLSSLGRRFCEVPDGPEAMCENGQSLAQYLDAITYFLSHPSLSLRKEAASVFSTFVANRTVIKSREFLEKLQFVVNQFPEITLKHGFPSKDDGVSSDFSREDYDSDVEFYADYTSLKARMVKVLQETVTLDWNFCFSFSQRMFEATLSHPIESDAKAQDMQVRKLEALVGAFKCLFDAFAKLEIFSNSEFQNVCSIMIDQSLLFMEKSQHLSYVDNQLSIFSSLLVCLPNSADKVPRLLELFARILQHPDRTSEESKSLKFHAVNCLIRLSTEFPALLLPHAERVFGLAQESIPFVSLGHRAKLLEALTAISNHFTDPGQQKSFLTAALAETSEFLLSAPATEGLSEPLAFLRFIGLCDPAPTTAKDAEESSAVKNRQLLSGHFQILEGVMARVATKGNSMETGAEITIQQAQLFECIKSLIPCLFKVARCLNGLCTVETLRARHPSYSEHIFDLTETEQASVRSFIDPATLSGGMRRANRIVTNEEYVQSFLSDMNDRVQGMIGRCVTRFGTIFFSQIPSAGKFLLFGAIGNLENCLDFRLRFLLRKSFLPIAKSLASKTVDGSALEGSYQSIVAIVVHLRQRLEERWSQIEINSSSRNNDSKEDVTVNEMFLEDMTCLLTREFIIFLSKLLIVDNEPLDDNEDAAQDENEANGTSEPACQQKKGKSKSERVVPSLSPIAKRLLRDPTAMVPVTLVPFLTLTWKDTKAALQAAKLCEPIVIELLENNLLDQNTGENYFALVRFVLSALGTNGEHENIQGPLIQLGMFLLESLLPKFPSICEFMVTEIQNRTAGEIQNGNSVPDSTSQYQLNMHEEIRAAMQAFVAKVTTPVAPGHIVPYKLKKQLFIKIVKDLIGKNLGQRYKRTEKFRDLPPVFKPKKEAPAPTEFNLNVLEFFGHS